MDETQQWLNQWKECKKESIPFLFIKKYFMQILIIENKTMLVYKNICILKEDFESFRYIAMIKALNTFTKKEYKHKFVQHYLRTFKSELRDYCKKLSKKSFQVLNYARSYSKDTYLCNKIIEQNDFVYDIETKDLVKKVINGRHKLTVQEKKVIFLKIKGFSNKEISQKIDIKQQSILSIFNKGIKKLKENYKILNNYNF